MTKSDWACGIAAAIIGGALLAFQFFILLREDIHPTCTAIDHSMVLAGDCNNWENIIKCKEIENGATICGLPSGRFFPND